MSVLSPATHDHTSSYVTDVCNWPQHIIPSYNKPAGFANANMYTWHVAVSLPPLFFCSMCFLQMQKQLCLTVST